MTSREKKILGIIVPLVVSAFMSFGIFVTKSLADNAKDIAVISQKQKDQYGALKDSIDYIRQRVDHISEKLDRK